MLRYWPVLLGMGMWTLTAVILFIAGLLLLKTWPISGFLAIVGALALTIKAVKTPDDMEWFGGVCLLLGAIYSTYLWIAKLW